MEQKISVYITHSKGDHRFIKFLLKLCVSLCVYIWVHYLVMQKKKNVFPATDYSQKIESIFDPSSHLILAVTLRLKKA